jgi:hypothetical protein
MDKCRDKFLSEERWVHIPFRIEVVPRHGILKILAAILPANPFNW